MSAVAGLWRPDGQPAGPGPIESMLTPIAHRGIDGTGRWFQGAVGLGHQLLATSDRKLKTLPALSRDGSLCITADARIDNREELSSVLGLVRSDLAGDAELILHAYGRWGDRCPEYLLGDFAFAIWDARRETLFCARDHFGVKPFFYYYRPDELFAVASEIRSLFGLSDIPRSLDDTRIGDFLVRSFEDRSITFFKDIRRLPPAHSLRVDRGGLVLRPYWELDRELRIHRGSDDDYANEFRELFTEAVRCRLGGVPLVGSMLSGGLDSSSIACVAADLVEREARAPLPTFSLVFERSTSSDERPYIDTVVARGPMTAHLIDADRVSPLEAPDILFGRLDQPPYASNVALSLATYREASSTVRVLLDGLHGDNTLFSYGDLYMAELLRHGRLGTLARVIRDHDVNFPGNARKAFKDFALKPLLPARALERWRRLRGVSAPNQPDLIQPSFLEREDSWGRKAARNARFDQPFQSAHQYHYYELTAGITASALELADQLAAAFSIEPRYPFLDKRLVEFCYGVPSRQKFLDGWPRSLLRRGMAGIVPDEIRWRRGKRGSGEWYLNNLHRFERSRIESLVSRSEELTILPLNTTALSEVVEAYLTRIDRSSAGALWEPLVLADWTKGVLSSEKRAKTRSSFATD